MKSFWRGKLSIIIVWFCVWGNTAYFKKEFPAFYVTDMFQSNGTDKYL